MDKMGNENILRTIRLYGKLLPVLAIATLFGCASPEEVRKRTPDFVVTSVKASKTVAVCIADKWENGAVIGTINVNMRPTIDGYTMSLINGSGGVGLLVDVTDHNNGSETRYFTAGVIGSGRFEAAVKQCQ